MEHHTLDVHINRPVHQFYRILYESLVFRVTYSGGIHSHVVKLSQSSKVLIDDWPIAVTSYDSCLQVLA